MLDRYEYTILQHFLPALINGDYESLEESDSKALLEFAAREASGLPECEFAHWDVDVADCSAFARCEVTGLYGTVADVALVFKTKES